MESKVGMVVESAIGYDHIHREMPENSERRLVTGTGFVDKDEAFSLGLELAHEWVDIGLPGADVTEEGALSTVIPRNISDGNRLLVDIHADKKVLDVVDCVMADLRGMG